MRAVLAAVVGWALAAGAAWACDKPRQMDGFKTCADVEAAFKEGALVLYSPDPEASQAAYLAEFRKQFPQIQTTFLRLQTGALYARLMAERQGRTFVPDALMLTEYAFALDFQKRGGWARYASPELAAYKPHQKSSPEGLFAWYDEIIAGIAYNPNLVSAADAPKSWKDLLNPAWAGAINTKLSTSGLMHEAWYTLRTMYGPDFWTKFAELKPRGFDSYVQQFDRAIGGQDKIVAVAQYSGYLISKSKWRSSRGCWGWWIRRRTRRRGGCSWIGIWACPARRP
jgi:iron(III) transport system substrate-binding protein